MQPTANPNRAFPVQPTTQGYLKALSTGGAEGILYRVMKLKNPIVSKAGSLEIYFPSHSVLAYLRLHSDFHQTRVIITAKHLRGKTFMDFMVFHSTAKLFPRIMALSIGNICLQACYCESFH